MTKNPTDTFKIGPVISIYGYTSVFEAARMRVTLRSKNGIESPGKRISSFVSVSHTGGVKSRRNSKASAQVVGSDRNASARNENRGRCESVQVALSLAVNRILEVRTWGIEMMVGQPLVLSNVCYLSERFLGLMRVARSSLTDVKGARCESQNAASEGDVRCFWQ